MERPLAGELHLPGSLESRELGQQDGAREAGARGTRGASEHRYLHHRRPIAGHEGDLERIESHARHRFEATLHIDAQAVAIGLPLALEQDESPSIPRLAGHGGHPRHRREAPLQRLGNAMRHLQLGERRRHRHLQPRPLHLRQQRDRQTEQGRASEHR